MMTVVKDDALLKALRETDSATHTLGAHVGVPRLELDRMRADDHHRLTPRERTLLTPRNGVFYGHHRDGFLRTPKPDWRPVAWVSATVLSYALPEYIAARVADAREPLGPLLMEAGAVRESLGAWYDSRADYSGEPVFLVSESRWTLPDGTRIALAREEVYEWVAHRAA